MLLVFWCLFEQQQKQEAIRRCRFRNRFHSSITLELKCESFFFFGLLHFHLAGIFNQSGFFQILTPLILAVVLCRPVESGIYKKKKGKNICILLLENTLYSHYK